MTAPKRRWFVGAFLVPLVFVLSLSALRLWQAIQDDSDQAILNGTIACAFFGVLTVVVAVWAFWRNAER
jgi:lipopolysaccharide export LptBFGC system permease protein LptF